ncbi:Protein of unknown function (DUF1576) [Sphaerochaeta pleomorpha str. Grapes]|uniref:DUF1576 domain-containing protein n=1 Tax=Sphaerochaeta pleomorpha (strain ATCC BAA-1885 / DSM 22778 / Grapes) TaxID=158190 RepID=G8QUV1_SPHPG|nr:DUF1576 domain-containing protein [Sphaerochaeta pleomorpha]AEV28127.1 Protein of unknown function (DUF1576) [Sphaerochaeta pleomorpha str. Grapes]
MERTEKYLYTIMLFFILALAIVGLAIDGPLPVFDGFLQIQSKGSRLINDFTTYGVGSAMFNAALVGLIGLSVVFFATVSLSGPTISAIFTMIGFGFFGKTPLNCVPVILGVWLAAKIAHKTLGSYSLIALFGTALGPVVTFVMFEIHLPFFISIPLALVSGLFVGFILPAVAGSMLQLHQGYNLYNTGFSCGFIGLFASSMLIATKRMEPITIVWNLAQEPALILFIPVLSVFLLFFAFLIDGFGNIRSTLKGFANLQKLSGRLPTDFFDAGSAGGSLVNMGLLGLSCSLYVWFVKAPFNGPVIGGILTVMGFGGFGKNLKNTWPIVAGVVLASLVFGKELSAPGPILAALFCTTLAPIAGQFGILAGIIAGFIHLFMVETTAQWHGGLDLYNNGFAGGLTATLLIAILEWYKNNRPKEDFEQ